MKYNVGDLLFVKECIWKSRPLRLLPRLLPRLHLHLLPRLHRPRLHPHLQNTYGIITAFEKHNDIFDSHSTEDDNGYVWYSQVDGKEYYLYEDEVDGEVVK